MVEGLEPVLSVLYIISFIPLSSPIRYVLLFTCFIEEETEAYRCSEMKGPGSEPAGSWSPEPGAWAVNSTPLMPPAMDKRKRCQMRPDVRIQVKIQT